MAYHQIHVNLDINAPDSEKPNHKRAAAKDETGKTLGRIDLDTGDIVAFMIGGRGLGGPEGIPPDITLTFDKTDPTSPGPASPFAKTVYQAPMDDDAYLQEGLEVVNEGDFEWTVDVDGPAYHFFLDPEMVVGGGTGGGK